MGDTLQVVVPLTDSWGGVYLQMVVTVIVFALGLPAILIQTVTGPEIHRIAAARRYDGSRLLILLMLVSMFLLFGMVLAYQNKTEWQWLADDRVIGLSAIALVGFTVCLSWWRIRLPARERLTRRIARDAVRIFREKRTIPDSITEDLEELGTAAPRRYDRELVLGSIHNIVRGVRACEHYRGSGLEQLILAIPRLAADPTQAIDDDNVKRGAKILLECLIPRTFEQKNSFRTRLSFLRNRITDKVDQSTRGAPDTSGPCTPTPDMKSAIRGYLRLLQSVALRSEEPTVNALLQDFSALEGFPPTLPASGLAQVGRLAAESGRYHIATICMTQIEDLLHLSSSNARLEIEARIVGLAAHIGANSGTAWESIKLRPIIEELFRPWNRDRFSLYISVYMDDQDYVTADRVSDLIIRTFSPQGPSSLVQLKHVVRSFLW